MAGASDCSESVLLLESLYTYGGIQVAIEAIRNLAGVFFPDGLWKKESGEKHSLKSTNDAWF